MSPTRICACGPDTAPAALPDEYQDGASAGSLVNARRIWLDLSDADTLPLPHHFTFLFHAPNRRMAQGLADCLRDTPYGGVVRTGDETGPAGDRWPVAGSTPATVWSLARLEHLSMCLRGVGSCHESALVTLDVQPCLR